MLQDSHPSVVASVGVAAFIAWRVYTRIRRMVGRQRLRTVRPWITVFLFPTLLALLLLSSIAHPSSVLALVAGATLGAALGGYGLRLTKFEQTPSGLFYTPNATWVSLSRFCSLFASVIVWRSSTLHRRRLLRLQRCSCAVPSHCCSLALSRATTPRTPSGCCAGATASSSTPRPHQRGKVPNPSIERTVNSRLRRLSPAAHVKR